MGAIVFECWATGRDANEAFQRVRASALYTFGHSGYSGTIAEKDTFELIERPKGVVLGVIVDSLDRYGRHADATALANEWWGSRAFQYAQLYDDKWGPALALPDDEFDDSQPPPEGERQYVFIGNASN